MQGIHYITAINLVTDFSTLMLCLLGGVILLGGPTINQRDRRYWLQFFVCLMIFTLSNLTGQLLRGVGGAHIRSVLYVTNYLEFILSGILIFIVAFHLLHIADPERSLSLMPWILRVAVAAHILMITISQFTGWFYEIDEMNFYHRNPLYPLTYLMPLGFILFILYLVVRYKKQLSRRERIAYTIYAIVPLLAGIIQVFIYGVYLIVFSMGVAALVLITFIVLDQTEHFYMQRQENLALKTDILIAQIRPHFLYNSLLVIQQVCLQDPKKASNAIGDFLRYLRHNMESISKETLIPFRDELNHVRHYVSLQQLRFGDDMTVDFTQGSASQTKPNPYVLSNWLQEATIKVTNTDGTDSGSAVRVLPEGEHEIVYDSVNDKTDASVTYKIINDQGAELPSAGGPGTTWIYLLGVILFIGCSTLLIARRRAL